LQPFGRLRSVEVRFCRLKEPLAEVMPHGGTTRPTSAHSRMLRMNLALQNKAPHSGAVAKGENDMSKIFYLAYGSNLNLEQMANRCPTAKMVGTATLENYQLLFRGGHANAVATIQPKQGGSVPVMLWDITLADEIALDRYEGWPFLYRKEKVRVTLNGKHVTAMVYIMNEGRPLGTPSCYYYNVILQGYRAAEFDVNILKQAVQDSV
jgi:hypothetical protein